MKALKQEAKKQDATFEIRQGANHTKCFINGRMIPVPRHNEINENLARHIIKEARDA